MIRRLLFLLALRVEAPLVLCRHRLQPLTLRVPRLPRKRRCFFSSGHFRSISVAGLCQINPGKSNRAGIARERITGSFSAAKNGAPQLSHDSLLNINE